MVVIGQESNGLRGSTPGGAPARVPGRLRRDGRSRPPTWRKQRRGIGQDSARNVAAPTAWARNGLRGHRAAGCSPARDLAWPRASRRSRGLARFPSASRGSRGFALSCGSRACIARQTASLSRHHGLGRNPAGPFAEHGALRARLRPGRLRATRLRRFHLGGPSADGVPIVHAGFCPIRHDDTPAICRGDAGARRGRVMPPHRLRMNEPFRAGIPADLAPLSPRSRWLLQPVSPLMQGGWAAGSGRTAARAQAGLRRPRGVRPRSRRPSSQSASSARSAAGMAPARMSLVSLR